MMEVVCTSETSVHVSVTTQRYIPEDSKLHARRRENLKISQFFLSVFNLKMSLLWDVVLCILVEAPL
jgi:hypothetical protein